ncbi:hypothetical protein [Alicyclobacillus acidoterrestris]|uniref:Uncharacterized protein n=1 Tax=Alicyclobacillus acidoterrestris (strain ATCC 49025 / DSM 3922 / CIP 106132 / NCIMB 13137 / GD3B) TaxID=1356854 RepID=T0DDT5_ALIAG|nr:hypothetical protein [Alicyclobacillus acidoterrestris]EPZ47811.1 hypothetical protein N007_04960 [Alicyclobacillus acidoterrestris ATCC 49025]UNO48769.1 hypothetical protein K1I37_19350 [Alicyclobacillus acidoterrestris]
MSFRADFINKINERYADDAAKRRSIESDWGKIRGYFTMFMEDISDVIDFALASVEENEKELALLVEGHELSFRKSDAGIRVKIDGDYVDHFTPTTEGYCVNFRGNKLLDDIDRYMALTFADVRDKL